MLRTEIVKNIYILVYVHYISQNIHATKYVVMFDLGNFTTFFHQRKFFIKGNFVAYALKQ